MEAAIIGVLGAGLLGLLGVFLQAMRSDLRSLGERIDARFAASETRLLTRIQEGEDRLLARIQEGEDRLLARIQEGEDRLLPRIQPLEAVLGEVKERLARIEATQEAHGQLLVQVMSHGERIAALEGAAATG